MFEEERLVSLHAGEEMIILMGNILSDIPVFITQSKLFNEKIRLQLSLYNRLFRLVMEKNAFFFFTNWK